MSCALWQCCWKIKLATVLKYGKQQLQFYIKPSYYTLTLVLLFYFYAHVLRSEVKSQRHLLWKTLNLFHLNCEPERIDHSDFKDSNFEDGGEPEIAIWPAKPKILIYESMTDILKIQTANLRFSTTASWMRVSPGDSNNDRQPEITAETGNTYISETIPDSIETLTENPVFSTMTNSIKVLPSEPEMARLASKTSILPFSVVDRCRNHLRTVSSSLAWSKPVLGISIYGPTAHRIFLVLAATLPFQFAVAITWQHLYRASI